METTATTKGQIVIPAALRKKYGIKAGTRIRITDEGERIILQPITRQYIHGLRGSLKGGGGLKALIEERRRERDR
ncbi:MAG: AbrB/MazE/SpoVT family DNA-binding domain-containing protein [Chloroflexi bacterium]|nr:AbrB/MazE/SpoVT family DNA-binding domain-containing protein [Chloroflexota bacterium]